MFHATKLFGQDGRLFLTEPCPDEALFQRRDAGGARALIIAVSPRSPDVEVFLESFLTLSLPASGKDLICRSSPDLSGRYSIAVPIGPK